MEPAGAGFLGVKIFFKKIKLFGVLVPLYERKGQNKMERSEQV